jgi:D-3-phosphoglycerate dehydrogenase
MKVLANDGMAASAAEKLKSLGYDVDLHHYEGEELNKKIQEIDCIIIRSATKIRKQLIDEALKTKQLKLIIRAGVGIDNIDHQYAQEQGIAVHNTPNSSSDAVAELALGHMFTLARHLHQANVTMRNGEWNKKAYKGIELNGKTLGLIGFGRIAQSLAKKAQALGMKIIYNDLNGPTDSVEDCRFATKEELLKEADFVSLHIPFVKELGSVINKEEFQMMKPTAYLINAARGGVVNETDLIEALNQKELAGAALDVFEQEPVKNELIFKHPMISLTPHIGASTAEAQERIGQETIDVIIKTLK